MTSEFSQEQIDKWTAEGHWPPPVGITVLPDVEPDPEKVKEFARSVAAILPKKQSDRVKKIFGLD